MEADPLVPARRRMAVLSLLALTLGVGFLLPIWLDRTRSGAEAAPRPVTPRASLTDEEQATIELFRNSSPAVVYITTRSRQINLWTLSVTEHQQGTGTGFLWDSKGHVVTNFHVLQNATSAQVVLHDQSTYPAKLVGVSPDHELAVLHIGAPEKELQPVSIGTSHDLQVGQRVLAIGNPFGLDQTLTTGIISALGRRIQSLTGRQIQDVIQTDAAINPGNSGGPLLDSAGRLIGVNTAIYSPSGASAGVGFAVPVDTVNRVVPQLILQGRYSPPKLGIRVDDRLSRLVLRQLRNEGLLILEVEPDSGAARAGLRGATFSGNGTVVPGDVIQQIEGQAIRNTSDLIGALERHRVGESVTVSISRGKRTMEVKIPLQ